MLTSPGGIHHMSHQTFLQTVVSTFNLTKTDAEIIKTLITVKSGLMITEITKRIKRSERNVRARVRLLFEKGLLKREIEILKNKRLAYRYSLQSYEKIIEKAKIHLFEKIGELNKLLSNIEQLNYPC